MKKQLLIAILLSAICLFSKQISHAQTQPMQVSIYNPTPMALYLNCGNEVMISIENYPFLDRIRFEVEGADIIKTERTNVMTVIPKQAQVIIRAYDENDKLISESKHPVRLLPKPDLELFINGRPHQPKGKYSLDELRSNIAIKAIAEMSITQTIPKDARYRISEFSAQVKRGAVVIKEEKVADEMLDLTSFLTNAQAGDVLTFEVKTLKRMNFKGELEDVKIGKQIFTLPIE